MPSKSADEIAVAKTNKRNPATNAVDLSPAGNDARSKGEAEPARMMCSSRGKINKSPMHSDSTGKNIATMIDTYEMPVMSASRKPDGLRTGGMIWAMYAATNSNAAAHTSGQFSNLNNGMIMTAAIMALKNGPPEMLPTITAMSSEK